MTLRIAMLDPSAFTIPYDVHLCRALAELDAQVVLFTRPMRRGEQWDQLPAAGAQSGESRFGTSAPAALARAGLRAAAADGEPGFASVEHFYRLSERLPVVSAVAPLKLIAKGLEHSWNMATFRSELRRFRPDVIHFQWSALPLVDAWFLKKLQALAPCVLTVHDTNAFLAPSSRLQKLGWPSILRRFDRLIVHTRSGRDSLVSLGVDPAQIAVIPHGVFDAGENYDHSRAQHSTAGQCVFLAFGTIKPYKGLDVLIRALAEIPPAVRAKMRLVIAGNAGGLEGELRQLAAQCGVGESIEWVLRFIRDEEIPALFARCDAVVFPYREIDASGALMTALPYGRAIVASRVGLFAELLCHEETALLVQPGDPVTLGAALARLVQEPSMTRELGQRAATLAREVCSWERIAEKTLALYHEALETRRRTFKPR